MANKTFNTRVKNKRDTAANWEAVATTFQPLDGELIIVDTSAGKTRFKVGRYDTAKGRLLYYNEIPFADEYLYNDLNESQGKIYDKLKGIDDKSIIEMTLESVFDNTKFVNYRIGLWQFPKTGFYKLNIAKRGTTVTQLFLYAQKTKEDGTTPEDPFSQDNLLRIFPLTGDKQVESVFVQVDYTDTDTLTVYKVQFLNVMTFPGTININTYNKTTQKWDFTSVTESSAKWANNATQVSNALTLTKGDTTTKFDGSTAQTVSIPTKTSELTNDSNFTTQTDLDNLTNTVVSYNAQENITDEQKAQARTNIGAISEADLVQSDWNQNDETAKDYVKNRPCYTVVTSETSREILQGSGTFTPLLGLSLGETYNINYSTNSGTEPSGEGTNYVCKDLHDTVSSAPTGTLYIGDINSDGSPDGYTIYEDHIELNSGFSYMISPQRWKITGNLKPTTIVPLPEKYYPKETAKFYVVDSNGERIENSIIQVENSTSGLVLSDKYKIKAVNSSLYAPPPVMSFYKGEATINFSNKSFDEIFSKTSKIPSGNTSISTANQVANNLISSVCNNNSFGIINLVLSDETLKFLVTKGSVTNTFPGQYNKYATNPVIVDRYSYDSNTKEYYFGLYTVSFIADSDGKYVDVNYKKWIDNTHLITTSDIDTALSSTSENPVQNKVVKTAIDTLQASIDSKIDTTTLNYGLTQVTNDIAANYVKFTAEQALTDEQKAQARENINAPAPADAVYTVTASSTDGVAYTATVPGIDSLTVGASFIMIPNKASTSKAPTLNVNGLGAKPIRRRLSSLTTSLQQGYSTNWIALNKPFTVVYDGTAWVIEGLTKTDGADVYGAVAQATADAKGNNIADTYATIAMLQSMLPKVTTITLTSNWVGDASPYYQDIALSCVTETSIVDLQPTPEQLNSWQDEGLAFTTLSGNGTVRVYVAGGKPSSAISVQVRVQEVTVI